MKILVLYFEETEDLSPFERGVDVTVNGVTGKVYSDPYRVTVFGPAHSLLDHTEITESSDAQ